MVKTGLEVLEYLVLKQMAGKSGVLRALPEYIRGSLSPSQAKDMYGVSREQLRGFVMRIYMKAVDRKLADIIVLRAAPIVLAVVVPRVNTVDGYSVCRICNKVLTTYPEDHIKKHHRKELWAEVRNVVMELRKTISAR